MNTEPLWFLDTLVVPRVPAAYSPDGLSVLESRARRGDSPPLHTHSEDELFVVIDGELLIKAGGEERTLRAGETLLGPRGVPHTYLVTSDDARWLTVTAKGDFEAFVRSFSRPATERDLPEASGPPSPEQEAALAEACHRHGIELVGPPLHPGE